MSSGRCDSTRRLRNATLISTFLLTVLFDLTIAVEVGMVLATLLLIKRLTEAAAVQVVTNLAKDPDAPALPLPTGWPEAFARRTLLAWSIAWRLDSPPYLLAAIWCCLISF